MLSFLQDQQGSAAVAEKQLVVIDLVKKLGIVDCSISLADDENKTEVDPQMLGSLMLEASRGPDLVIIAHTKGETMPQEMEVLLSRLESLMENIGLYARRVSMSHDFSSSRAHFVVGKSKFSFKDKLLVVFREGTFLSLAFFARTRK